MNHVNPETLCKFKSELRLLINRLSIENWSDTPDWLIADYLAQCLVDFSLTTYQRERYYNRVASPVPSECCPKEAWTALPPKP